MHRLITAVLVALSIAVGLTGPASASKTDRARVDVASANLVPHPYGRG